ncbi:hypothetical protein KSS87_019226 [Heliosperma pusillum]|nr:hypothetical protein KSS87_019226 [Heliosperma pusillum]
MKQTYELAEECLQTNYYGVKRTINAVLPLLQLSDSPRIVNISSDVGLLKKIPGERIREALGDVEKLTEERLDEILEEFLRDFKEGTIAEKGVVKTDINCKMGHLTVEEGAVGPVTLALMPHGSPSGLFYTRNEVTSFE